MRMLLTIRYDGTAYHGWQVQQNALAVQPVVQDALQQVLGERPGLSGCSRTDAGVHAEMYCCHFDTERAMEPHRLIAAVNSWLPRDIAAYDCQVVPDDFHARYSCREKEYGYHLLNAPHRNPFYEGYAVRVHRPMDLETLNRAAAAFVGTHDFASFCSSGAKPGETVRSVSVAELFRQGDLVTFHVRADGFLYNMVRIMAGTLLGVHGGRLAPEDVATVIASRRRSAAGPTAPAHGLYLTRVIY